MVWKLNFCEIAQNPVTCFNFKCHNLNCCVAAETLESSQFVPISGVNCRSVVALDCVAHEVDVSTLNSACVLFLL